MLGLPRPLVDRAERAVHTGRTRTNERRDPQGDRRVAPRSSPKAMTTLNTCGRPWPDADESARTAVGVVLAARADSLSRITNLADQMRTRTAS